MPIHIHTPPMRGLSTIGMVIALPALLMMAIFGLEIALLYRTAGKAKAAADAAALAAAARITQGMEIAAEASEQIVAEYSGPNGTMVILVSPENGPGSEVEFGRWQPDTRTFQPTIENPNAVRTTINFNQDHPNGAVPVFFGELFNLPYTTMRRQSIAQIRVESAKPMLLLRNPMGSNTLKLDDAATLRAPVSTIDVASIALNAVLLRDNTLIECVELRVSGDAELLDNAIMEGVLLTGTTAAEDPFQGTPLPSSAGQPVQDAVAETAGQTTIPPGIYESGFQYDQGTYILSAGLYFLRGEGLNLGGSAQLIGTDARIILEGNDASIWLQGNSKLNLDREPPFPIQPNMMLIGLNTAPRWLITDDATITIAGAIYAPSVSVQILDGSWTAGSSILRKLQMKEDSTMDITGNGFINATTRRSRAVLVQ